MSTCPERIVDQMHEYLDGEISAAHEKELKAHLETCTACQKHLHELSKTIAFVKSASHVSAPEGFKDRVVARLPKEKRYTGIQRWFRQHPIATAASLFLLLMSSSLFSNFNDDQQFSVTKQENIIVQGQTVIVPEGETVKGDLVVRNGDLQIKGEVDGNVTIINGAKYMASTANVTGQIEEINKAFEWLWYKIKTGFKDAVSFMNQDEEKENKE
jgi:anti-sigma factor (TIGR02949 family)